MIKIWWERIKVLDFKDITFKRILLAIVHRIVNIPHIIAWYLPTKKVKENKYKLLSYKDKHIGKRCFILANGPSLNNMDLSLLKEEITIGMNRIYLMEKVNGFIPTYIAVADIPIQLRQFITEYNNLEIPRFFDWNARNLFSIQNNLIFFKQSFKMHFQPDITKPVGAGKSVTYFCLQLAFYMGFSEVILIGKDHSYNIKGKPGVTIKSNGKEGNHFIKGYYKPNQKWRIPNYSEEEYSYRLARLAYEKAGKKIYDATIGGKLNIFEKVDYYSLFKKS